MVRSESRIARITALLAVILCALAFVPGVALAQGDSSLSVSPLPDEWVDIEEASPVALVSNAVQDALAEIDAAKTDEAGASERKSDKTNAGKTADAANTDVETADAGSAEAENANAANAGDAAGGVGAEGSASVSGEDGKTSVDSASAVAPSGKGASSAVSGVSSNSGSNTGSGVTSQAFIDDQRNAISDEAQGDSSTSDQASTSDESSSNATDSSSNDASSSSSSSSTVDANATKPPIAGPHTISWANSSSDAQTWFNDANAVLQNGTATLVSVVSGSETLTATQLASKTTSDSAYYLNGVLCAPAGSTVTMDFLPTRGYQLASTSINDGAIKVTPVDEEDAEEETPGRFTFAMPSEGVALDCGFTATQDVVEVDSEAVSGGSISGGESVTTATNDEDETVNLDSGTLVLTVYDLEDDDDEKKGLTDSATKLGSSASDIVAWLDVSLDNVLYQGTADDTWDVTLTELNSAISMTFTLSDAAASGASSFYVIREHDGDYQKAPATFDASSKTVTFKSDKFSTFAVVRGTASSESASESSTSTSTPQTGDTDRMTGLALLAALAGLVMAFAWRRMRMVS